MKYLVFLVFSICFLPLHAEPISEETLFLLKHARECLNKGEEYGNEALIKYNNVIASLEKDGSDSLRLVAEKERLDILIKKGDRFELLRVIDEAIVLAEKLNDNNRLSRFLFLKFNEYHTLGFQNEAKQILEQVEQPVLATTDSNTRNLNLGYLSALKTLGTDVSSEKTFHFVKSYEYMMNVEKESPCYRAAQITGNSSLASAFFFRDQIDSAKHYFKKSMSYIDPKNALFDDYYAIIKFTTLLHHLNEYAEEEKLLQQALSQAQKNDNLYQQETILYKLYKNYQLQEDYSNAYSALGMLAQLKEIVDQKKLNLISEVEQSIEERVNVLTMNLGKRESLINYLLIGIVLLVCFALWGFVRSLSPISDSNLVPEISQTQETDYSLNRRRVSIEEINELNTLIKQADPTFLVKFNEYFPLFSEKLNELADPPLNYPEMEICALTKFNYNTKEIAMYRNQSVRSVENRKYRIRKKLNLSPEEDFTLWIAYL